MKQSPERKQEAANARAAARRFHVAIDAYLYGPNAGTPEAEAAFRGARGDFERDGLAYFVGSKAVTIESRQRRGKRSARSHAVRTGE